MFTNSPFLFILSKFGPVPFIRLFLILPNSQASPLISLLGPPVYSGSKSTCTLDIKMHQHSLINPKNHCSQYVKGMIVITHYIHFIKDVHTVEIINLYFIICFAQTKITLFIFVNNWVIRENESFLLVEPLSHVTCCVQIKLQYFFRKYIFIYAIYTLLILFRQFFMTHVKFMVAATLGKNIQPAIPTWSIGQWLFCR